MTLEQFKTYVNKKNIAVVGIGVSNTPLIRLLADMGAYVTARDQKTAAQLGGVADVLEGLGVKLILGGGYLDGMTEDIIFKTPGMRIDAPPLVRAKEHGAVITSEMEMFFQLCPAEIIAVTGSDGKTTTTTLIYEMLKAAGYQCRLGGNIGKPLLSEIARIGKDDKIILELSSFQLHTMTQSPHTAVITNVSPNHLDVHKSMEEYIGAKEKIFQYQDADGILALNFDNEITKSFAAKARGTVIPFGKTAAEGVHIEDGVIYMRGHAVLRRGDIRLPGEHNVENYMAAIAAVWGRVDSSAITRVAETFGGVEHRIEFVREKDGVRYYNDSIASSPTRARAGLYAFDQKIILIAGGYDKKIPFDAFGEDLVKRAKAVILLGATAEKIKAAVENAPGEKPPIISARDLSDAVSKAAAAARSGDVVMLSPACASFDMFKNFEERGLLYKSLVNEL
ncbi:MAG: UDP-N-acetylmuramoyl-L-alanine--D-glutamate ligase [Clostridiales bacterium]|jgi:UDP-N-acetylmuramoylalanine--D-glutamate ligase|nr:UDP-N-acetylmuramoyl-L-alanine--D-glutamate ligase [Clostridiales bacterium]